MKILIFNNEDMVRFNLEQNFILILLCIYTKASIYAAIPVQDPQRLAMCDIGHNDSTGNFVQCNVTKGQLLDYRDIRNWSAEQKGGTYSIQINCAGGLVYLPWPFKARNIVSLEVYRCTVLGLLSEMTMRLNVPDQLHTLILSEISVEIPLREIIQLRNRVDQIPRSTDCGQLTLEKLVLRGMHYDLKMSPEERDGMRQAIFTGNEGHTTHHAPCIYRNLKYIDESGSRKSGQYHLKLIPEYSKFPALEVYNMSGNALDHIPDTFRHLHSGKFPSLRHIDFSNNVLKHFEFDFPRDPKTCKLEIVDLHNNQINSISNEITRQLNNVGTILVDLRQNPLRCTCGLAFFRQYLESQYQKASDVSNRQRVADITCTKGSRLQGKLSTVSLLNATFDQKCHR